LQKQKKIQEWIDKYNAEHHENRISSHYWDQPCFYGLSGAALIEELARFGDCTLLDRMPIPKLFDMTMTMSYTGIDNLFKTLFLDRKNTGDFTTIYELSQKEVSL